MPEKEASPANLDIVLPIESDAVMPPLSAKTAFDADATLHFQAKMKNAPEWFCSFVASSTHEKRRFRNELVQMKGAWPLPMKQRKGGKWTTEEKAKLKIHGALFIVG